MDDLSLKELAQDTREIANELQRLGSRHIDPILQRELVAMLNSHADVFEKADHFLRLLETHPGSPPQGNA